MNRPRNDEMTEEQSIFSRKMQETIIIVSAEWIKLGYQLQIKNQPKCEEILVDQGKDGNRNWLIHEGDELQ